MDPLEILHEFFLISTSKEKLKCFTACNIFMTDPLGTIDVKGTK